MGGSRRGKTPQKQDGSIPAITLSFADNLDESDVVGEYGYMDFIEDWHNDSCPCSKCCGRRWERDQAMPRPIKRQRRRLPNAEMREEEAQAGGVRHPRKNPRVVPPGIERQMERRKEERRRGRERAKHRRELLVLECED